MSVYLANHMKPVCPLFPVPISGGVTKVKHMCSIVLAGGSERSTEDNMGDGGELLPKSNSTSGIWGYFGDRRDDMLQLQVMPNSGGCFYTRGAQCIHRVRPVDRTGSVRGCTSCHFFQ